MSTLRCRRGRLPRRLGLVDAREMRRSTTAALGERGYNREAGASMPGEGNQRAHRQLLKLIGDVLGVGRDAGVTVDHDAPASSLRVMWRLP